MSLLRHGVTRAVLHAILATTLALSAGACSADPDSEEVSSAADSLTSARVEYDALRDADANLERLETRLSRELIELAPALTTDHVKRYTSEYRKQPAYLEAHAKYRSATANLAAALRKSLPELDVIARSHARPRPIPVPAPNAPPPNVEPIYELPAAEVGNLRSEIVDYYALLARTPAAADALAFASHLVERDTFYAKALMDSATGGHTTQTIVDRIVAPALPQATVAGLARTNDAALTMDELRTLAGAQSIVSKVVGLADAFARSAARDRTLLHRSISGGSEDVTRAFQLGDTKLGAAIDTVGVILTLWTLGDTSKAHPDALAQLLSTLEQTAAGFDAVLSGTQLVRRFIFGLEASATLDKTIKFVGKIGTGLGVLIGAGNAIEDLRHWNASDAAKVRLLGDVLGMASGVLLVAGAGGPLGLAIGLASIGVMFFADALAAGEAWRLEEAEQRSMSDEKRIILRLIGLEEPLPETLAFADASMMSALSKNLEMTSPLLRKLALLDPGVVRPNAYERPKRYVRAQMIKCGLRLNGEQLYEMLAATAGTESRARKAELVDRFFMYFEHEYGSVWGLPDFDAYFARLQRLATDPGLGTFTDDRIVFTRVVAYLQPRAAALRTQSVTPRCGGR
jgi:hypothetical protein